MELSSAGGTSRSSQPSLAGEGQKTIMGFLWRQLQE